MGDKNIFIVLKDPLIRHVSHMCDEAQIGHPHTSLHVPHCYPM